MTARERRVRRIGNGLIAATMIAFVAFALSQPARPGARPASQPGRSCFPAKRWDAKPSRRPCARIVRVFEDGSVRLRVEDAGGRFRYRAGVGARDR
jgi:hypothetical protein